MYEYLFAVFVGDCVLGVLLMYVAVSVGVCVIDFVSVGEGVCVCDCVGVCVGVTSGVSVCRRLSL